MIKKVEVCLDFRIITILGCLLVAGCGGQDTGSGKLSKDPKSSYGQAVKRAYDLQTPSADEQENREQEQELLKD